MNRSVLQRKIVLSDLQSSRKAIEKCSKIEEAINSAYKEMQEKVISERNKHWFSEETNFLNKIKQSLNHQ